MFSVQNQAMMSEKAIKNASSRCEITWNALSENEWEALFTKIKRPTLLQSLPYARAMASLNQQKIRRGLIQIDGQKAGMLTLLEASIFKNAVHGIILDRGPLWFDGFGTDRHVRLFLEAFSKNFPRRFGRRIRLLPEIENSAPVQTILKDQGYKRASSTGYKTIWLDLRPDLETLRNNLNKKWRNTLKKGEKNNLDITWHGKHFVWLMNHYTQDKATRNYDGASLKTIHALAREFSRGQNMMVGTALLEGQPIAAILLLIHGSGATYQIGYTSDTGREKCAHHLLLWNAIKALKERKVNDFDAGGIHPEEAKGVTLFKQGLGGKIFETVGMYH